MASGIADFPSPSPLKKKHLGGIFRKGHTFYDTSETTPLLQGKTHV